eukprot:scaffold8535_cov132-Cylindrotheca_fusiformis.AAC.7
MWNSKRLHREARLPVGGRTLGFLPQNTTSQDSRHSSRTTEAYSLWLSKPSSTTTNRMGKRKSKVSKQKQAKAKQKQGKKISSLGGVSVSKGFSSKFQQAKSPATIVVDPKNNNNNKHKAITEASLRQKLKSKAKKVFMSPPASNRNKGPVNDEQKEFHRQMASLQERQMADVQKNMAKKKALDFVFQQPSFSFQKSPQDLIQETTRQMETMTGVGEQGIGSFSSTPVRTNQSWAVASKNQQPMSTMANNPFGVLGGGDSGDEDEEKELIQKVPSLSLAPATFSLLPRITPTPAASPHPSRFEDDGEYDPDL